jgi:GalNAc-alpha-(1->4)-GalNAc-alpha-(1->3)-diNAcBac-PP-undecaprenol alpha-1,4-N-acetyl-D-galactosaminyltransferase
MTGGGSERQMSCLANELARSSSPNNVSLLTLSSSDNDRYSLDLRIQRIGLGLTSSRGGIWNGTIGNWNRIRSMRRVQAELKPKVVVSFCDSTNILSLLAFSGRVPVIISERSDPRRQVLSRPWEWLRSMAYPRANLCVAQTDSVAKYLKERYFHRRPDQVLTIPSAIDAPDIDLASCIARRASNSPCILLFVGRLAPEKRLDRLLEAWSTLGSLHAEWRLRIIGEGPLEMELKRQAERLGISASIDWIPWTNRIWDHWTEANAFALSSDYEGFPQCILEGMTAGLPGIVTNCSPAISQIMENGVHGVIVSGNDNYSESLKSFLSHPLELESMGIRAAQRAKLYHWPTVAPQWIGAIQSLTTQ